MAEESALPFVTGTADHQVGSGSVPDLLHSNLACALTDPSGIITAASPGLQSVVPNVVGKSIDDALGLAGDGDGTWPIGVRVGVYDRPQAGLSPVAVQFLPVSSPSHSSLAIVCDGQPFRAAENARMAAAPYGAVRIASTGRIVFANPAASELLGLPSSEIVGRQLQELFDGGSAETISAAIRSCIGELPAQVIEVRLPEANGVAGQDCRMLFSPDRAPGGRIIGVVAIIQSALIEKARDDIKRIAMGGGPWRARFDQVLARIAAVLPFDQAVFGIYAENLTLFRPMHLAPESARPWPTLWMNLRQSSRAFLDSGKTWANVKDFLKDQPELRKHPVTQQYLKDHIQCFVVISAPGKDGPSSSLSLMSREADFYGRDSLLRLKALDLEQVLLMFERAIADERVNFIRKIQEQIRTATSLRFAAERVVGEIRQFFGWDHVSLLSVEGGGELRLLCQSYRKGHKLPATLRPSANAGLLGHTLARNPDPKSKKRKVVILEDARRARKGRRPLNDRSRSAMAYPVKLKAAWRWILNIEARVTNAFHGPDVEALREIVSKLEAELERLYTSQLNRVLLSKIPEGVVVTDNDGRILRANRAASERMLEWYDDKKKSEILADYAANETAADVLTGRVAGTSRRIELVGTEGGKSTVLATRECLEEGFQSSVWFLSDVANFEWNVEYRYLQEVVQDVAQQTRGPSLLATTHLQRLVAGIKDEAVRASIASVARRVLAEIARADITFERLAENVSIVKQPKRSVTPVDLAGIVSNFIETLPERDRPHVDLVLPGQPVIAEADVGRLTFVVRTIGSYLLRCRPGDDGEVSSKVVLAVADEGEDVRLELSLSGLTSVTTAVPEASKDPIWTWMQKAHEDAGLALDAVQHVVEAHQAVLVKRRSETAGVVPLWTSFEIRWPRRQKA
jgi:PAS domain S-box-containing protein